MREKITKLLGLIEKSIGRDFVDMVLYGGVEVSPEWAERVKQQWKRQIPAIVCFNPQNLKQFFDEEDLCWIFLFVWKTQPAYIGTSTNSIWGSELYPHVETKIFTYEERYRIGEISSDFVWEGWFEELRQEKKEGVLSAVEETKRIAPLIKKILQFLEDEIGLEDINNIIRERRRKRKEKEEKEG